MSLRCPKRSFPANSNQSRKCRVLSSPLNFSVIYTWTTLSTLLNANIHLKGRSLTIVVAWDGTYPDISYFDVPVVRINVNRLACEFPVDEILRVQVVHTLQDLPCPLFDHT